MGGGSTSSLRTLLSFWQSIKETECIWRIFTVLVGKAAAGYLAVALARSARGRAQIRAILGQRCEGVFGLCVSCVRVCVCVCVCVACVCACVLCERRHGDLSVALPRLLTSWVVKAIVLGPCVCSCVSSSTLRAREPRRRTYREAMVRNDFPVPKALGSLALSLSCGSHTHPRWTHSSTPFFWSLVNMAQQQRSSPRVAVFHIREPPRNGVV